MARKNDKQVSLPAAEPAEPLDRFLNRSEQTVPLEMLAAFGAKAMREGWHRATPSQWDRRLSDFANSTP